MEKPKVGDRVRVLPYLFKLRAFWVEWYARPEHYIGAIGDVIDPSLEEWSPMRAQQVVDPSIPEVDIKLDPEYVCQV